MRWNWTQPDWPNFRHYSAIIEPLERRFLLSSGDILGTVRHVTDEERDRLRIELLSKEAARTSAVEGEVLDLSSVQSFLRRQFGLTLDGAPPKPREQGIAEMMVDVHSTFAAPLSHDTLCR
jgi:Fic family protein